ncbi:MAG: quinol:cytochrome C oxidoreductase [Planctomycetaceae bacterium]|nr:quinol:cytochrome C oxidoreductase [Planctomycetaceae bacterium]
MTVRLKMPPIGSLPRWMIYVGVIGIIASWLPLTLIARARVTKSDKPRIHFFQDMDVQPRSMPQALNRQFADNRAMRPQIPGTVARGHLKLDDHFYRGYAAGEFDISPDTGEQEPRWLTGFPAGIDVNEKFVRRGQERFNIFCAPCHGQAGYGSESALIGDQPISAQTGSVPRRTERIGQSWTVKSIHSDVARDYPEGRLFDIVGYGINTMAGYAAQISVKDRWAIVAYVRALQLSQHATSADVSD